jgi:hypothetical protein
MGMAYIHVIYQIVTVALHMLFAFLSSHYGHEYYLGLVKGQIETFMMDCITGTSSILTRVMPRSPINILLFLKFQLYKLYVITVGYLFWPSDCCLQIILMLYSCLLFCCFSANCLLE